MAQVQTPVIYKVYISIGGVTVAIPIKTQN